MRKFCKEISLAYLNPELAKEWDHEKNCSLKPEDVAANSHIIVWWKCKKGHSYNATIQSRNSGCNCPYCSGHRVCKDNCLATVNPKLSKEWNYKKNGKLSPENVTCGSSKKPWWTCNNGHTWMAAIKERSRGAGCPYCSGDRACSDNCLSVVNPKLAKEWNYEENGKLTPMDVVGYSSKKVSWKCQKEHKWVATIASRNQGRGCPYCSGNKVSQDNCLAIVNPSLAKEWDYDKNGKLTPNDVTELSGIKVYWKCSKMHLWESTISNRSNGSACPYCSGNKVCIDNCLATLNPELVKEWHPTQNGKLTPYDVTSHSSEKVYWKCKDGHIWRATIDNRSRGAGCPVCKYNRIILKDGTICDSLPEAYCYLKYKKRKVSFRHHISISLGRCVCDFYIPNANKYIEVTSFDKKWKHWPTYHKNILKKKHHITKVLKAKFKFIQLKLTPQQIRYVRENSI